MKDRSISIFSFFEKDLLYSIIYVIVLLGDDYGKESIVF